MLTGKLYLGYYNKKIKRIDYVIFESEKVNGLLKVDQRVYEGSIEGKVEYTSASIKGLKADVTAKYGYDHAVVGAGNNGTVTEERSIKKENIHLN